MAHCTALCAVCSQGWRYSCVPVVWHWTKPLGAPIYIFDKYYEKLYMHSASAKSFIELFSARSVPLIPRTHTFWLSHFSQTNTNGYDILLLYKYCGAMLQRASGRERELLRAAITICHPKRTLSILQRSVRAAKTAAFPSIRSIKCNKSELRLKRFWSSSKMSLHFDLCLFLAATFSLQMIGDKKHTTKNKKNETPNTIHMHEHWALSISVKHNDNMKGNKRNWEIKSRHISHACILYWLDCHAIVRMRLKQQISNVTNNMFRAHPMNAYHITVYELNLSKSDWLFLCR